jgi:hypothetical protein
VVVNYNVKVLDREVLYYNKECEEKNMMIGGTEFAEQRFDSQLTYSVVATTEIEEIRRCCLIHVAQYDQGEYVYYASHDNDYSRDERKKRLRNTEFES